jgi:hypothetical protein
MLWTVQVNRRIQRQIAALPLRVQQSLVALWRGIAAAGCAHPYRRPGCKGNLYWEVLLLYTLRW